MEFLGLDLDRAALEQWIVQVWEFALPRLAESLALLIFAGALWFVGRWTLVRVERSLTARTHTRIDDLLARLVRRLVLLSIVFWVVWRLAWIWDLGATSRAVTGVWIVGLTLPLSDFVSDALRVVEERLVPRTETTLDDTALPLLNKVVRFIVVGIGVLVALQTMGINVTPVLAGAGVLGLAISLAAKDTLSNLIAGILLILDRPFQVGDRIELWNAPAETGTWGDIVEIGLRATKIRNPDNLIIVIPNNEIMRRDIINYTASGPHIRVRIPIGIAYDADVEKARRLILHSAAAVPGVKETPEPVVILRSFGEFSVDLQLRVWIDDARKRRAVADAITERIMRVFDEHGIEIPYPKRDLYLKTPPEEGGKSPLIPLLDNEEGSST